MSPRVVRLAVERVVSQVQEQYAGWDVALEEFAKAYVQLRRVCPTGDLRIELSIDKTVDGDDHQ